MKVKALITLGVCLILTSSFVKNGNCVRSIATDKAFIDLVSQSKHFGTLSASERVSFAEKVKYLRQTYDLFNGTKESRVVTIEALHLLEGNKEETEMQVYCEDIYFTSVSFCSEQYYEDEDFDYIACETAAWGAYWACKGTE
ncbi:MAG TPA: hypothetical protein VL728_02790 [Cyclobacteriaceae bacterium]|jgi:hypothetical protein|nr:hypothetical protein [Cyclobacteriaceae bacterium]